MKPVETLKRKDTIAFREPTREDGSDVWELIKACEPLDVNSRYCNLIQCDHFAETCVAAIRADGKLVGWISAYLLPDDPQTLFVWQVATDPARRGEGIAGRMLDTLVARLVPRGVRYLEATVTPSNEASSRMFAGVARRARATIVDPAPGGLSADVLGGGHEAEDLLRIGPFPRGSSDPTT